MNRNSDFFLIVEQFPQSNQAATAIIRYFALVNVDRSLFRNVIKYRLQNSGAEDESKIGIDASRKGSR